MRGSWTYDEVMVTCTRCSGDIPEGQGPHYSASGKEDQGKLQGRGGSWTESYKKFGSHQSDRWGRHSRRGNSTKKRCGTSSFMQRFNKYLQSKVLWAVNGRHGSASRSVLTGEGRLNKPIMSIQYCKHNNRGACRKIWSSEEGLPSRFFAQLNWMPHSIWRLLLACSKVQPPGSSVSWLLMLML